MYCPSVALLLQGPSDNSQADKLSEKHIASQNSFRLVGVGNPGSRKHLPQHRTVQLHGLSCYPARYDLHSGRRGAGCKVQGDGRRCGRALATGDLIDEAVAPRALDLSSDAGRARFHTDVLFSRNWTEMNSFTTRTWRVDRAAVRPTRHAASSCHGNSLRPGSRPSRP